MTQNNNHKKLIVFDFNLDWKQTEELYTKNKDLPLVFDLMKKANEYQTLVLSTSGCFFDAFDFLNKQGIDKGYLIANGGSIVYDITNKKVIAKHFLDKADVKTLFHHGYTNNLNIIFSTETNKYIFVSNTVFFEKIKNKVYSSFAVIENYSQLMELLDKHDILDLAFISPYLSSADAVETLKFYNIFRYFDNEVVNFIIKVNKTSMFIHIGSSQSTKYKAIQTVMNHAEVDSPNDVLYIPSTCCNKECYVSFKNCIIAEAPQFRDELGDWKKEKNLSEAYDKLDPKLGLESDSFWK